jgi:protease I
MKLRQQKILAFVDEDFEDLEMWYPVLRLREEGASVEIVGPKSNTVYYGKYGVPIHTEYAFSEVKSSSYIGLYIPGGWAPDKLRRDSHVLQLTKEFHLAQKPIAQICHAGWVMISAKIVHGYQMTSTPGIRDDLENAGAIWIDQEVVIDRNIISGRRPPDLPVFTKAFIDELEKYLKKQ